MLDALYELSKYRGIVLTPDDDAIRLFHHYQKLIQDSRQQDGLDPYPIKHIGNFKVLVDAQGEMFKSLSKIIAKAMTSRR